MNETKNRTQHENDNNKKIVYSLVKFGVPFVWLRVISILHQINRWWDFIILFVPHNIKAKRVTKLTRQVALFNSHIFYAFYCFKCILGIYYFGIKQTIKNFTKRVINVFITSYFYRYNKIYTYIHICKFNNVLYLYNLIIFFLFC